MSFKAEKAGSSNFLIHKDEEEAKQAPKTTIHLSHLVCTTTLLFMFFVSPFSVKLSERPPVCRLEETESVLNGGFSSVEDRRTRVHTLLSQSALLRNEDIAVKM